MSTLSHANELSNAVIAAAIEIHRATGPGIMESAYEAMLAHRLLKKGFKVERQVVVPINFDGIKLDEGFRIDLLIEETLVVEIKSIQCLLPVHTKQVLTYLRMMHRPLGLILNFGCPTLKEGIKRVVNDLPSSASALIRVNHKQS